MGDSGDTDALVRRFCPPLDPSLVLALCSESDRAEMETIQILSDLSEAARVEEAVDATQPADAPAPVLGTEASKETEEHDYEKDSVLNFLAQSFPNKTPDALQRSLEESQGDVDVAMDALLAQDMLSLDVGAKHAPKKGGLDYDALASGMQRKKPSRSKAKAGGSRKAQTVSLTDQRSAHHIYADRRTLATSSSQRSRASSPPLIAEEGLDDAEFARRLQNAEKDAVAANEKLVGDQQWLLASSTLTQLASLLDVPQTKIQSIFNQASFNLHVTMARAMAYAAAQPMAMAAQQAPAFPVVCETLTSITGGDPRVISEVLAATKGEQSAALDLLQLREVVATAADGVYNRPDLLDPTAKLASDDPSVALYTPTITQKRQVGPGPAPRWLDANDRTYAGRSTGAAASTPSSSSLAADALRQGQTAVVLPASAQQVELSAVAAEPDLGGSFSKEECQLRAAELREKRDAALRQAAVSARRYRGASATLGGAASVYAEEARKYDTAARRWQMRAASALVEQRQTDLAIDGRLSEMERIDLHGLTVHEALTVVQQKLARSRSGGARTFLEIITGRGVHSRHNVSVLRPALVRYLQQRGYTVDSSSNPGALYVKQVR